KSVRAFPDRVPVSYEEDKSNAGRISALREQMIVFSEQADPQYWKTAPTADGKHIQFWNDPPSLKQEKYKEQQERHVQHNQYPAMAMRATKSLETGNIDERLTLDDALTRARSWDRPDLFDARTESYDERYQAAAVVGAAYVAARNAPPEAWSDEL